MTRLLGFFYIFDDLKNPIMAGPDRVTHMAYHQPAPVAYPPDPLKLADWYSEARKQRQRNWILYLKEPGVLF